MAALNQQIDRDVIWQMLQGIPSDDRVIWIEVGMALKSELGNDGFSLFDDWSDKADNYDSNAVKAVWKSFKGSGIAIGTLVKLAKEYGWKWDNKEVTTAPVIKPAPKPVKSDTQMYAFQLWLASNKADSFVAQHQYSIGKGIKWTAGASRGIASGSIIGKKADCVIIPIRTIESNKVQAVQCINEEGKKQTFGPVKGGALILGNTLNKSLTWYICEGWASAVSMVFHHQNGNGVCAASFGKYNQDSVAKRIAEVYQPDEIVILKEDDS